MATDYASLRREGLRLLQRMTGGQWTDFNTHDPGITLLEQLCYVISDLGYRAGFGVPDLLAEGGSDPYASLHPPSAILTSQPVTPADLRRIVLDVDGVRNAWVEVAVEGIEGPSGATALQAVPAKKELRFLPQDGAGQPLRPSGLHRILIEASGDRVDGEVRAEVARRLHGSRALCEDFAEITVLKIEPIQVEATVEVSPIDDPRELMVRIQRRIADQISPPVPFATLAQQLDAGVPLDEILEGPRLGHGFLSDRVLASATRKREIHTSDLMHEIMGVAGVRAVSRIRISKSGAWEEWALGIDADKVARLDPGGLKLTLRRAGKVIASELVPPPVPTGTGRSGGLATAIDPLALPPGRNRNVVRYTSVQQHLPAIYGIGETGLPDSASAERKAQAQQLKAYLLFFDQLLANSFSQLAHVKDLFAFDSGPRTYFTQAVDQPGLGLDEVRPLDEAHRSRLQDLAEGAAASWERKNRFLNHLLARFAEPLGDHAPSLTPAAPALPSSLEERARIKQELLQHYPRCSGSRGSGSDLLGESEDPSSGLEERIALKLGLDPDRGERLIAVEHILLRPMREDGLSDAQAQQIPLLSGTLGPDPYSLQLTFVLCAGAGRFAQPEFRRFVEQTLRSETPAHLCPYVAWMESAAWAEFISARKEWLRLRRSVTAQDLGTQIGSPDPRAPSTGKARAIDLRGARDRVIDLLAIGETYPLQDADVRAQSLTVNYDYPVLIDLDPAQIGVRYELHEGSVPVGPEYAVIGTGAKAVLTGPRLKTDRTFRILATKLDRPERRAYLLKTVTVKIGLNAALPVSLGGVSPDAPVFDHGSRVEVKIQGSQPGVVYRLLDPKDADISAATVLGNGGEISVFTNPLFEDTVLRVKATRDFDPAEGREPLRILLTAVLPVAIRANPDVAIATDDPPFIDAGGNATVTITGSQKSAIYSVYVRALTDADFVFDTPPDPSRIVIKVAGAPDVQVKRPGRPAAWQIPPGHVQRASGRGTDGTLRLSVGPIQEDSVLVVLAHKDHTTVPIASDVQLKQSAALLVRPELVPGLTLQLVPNAGGQSGTLLVSGGQPGVFYRFRADAAGSEIGRPVYFHRVDDSDPDAAAPQPNRGLGLLRVEGDLVIAREQPLPAGADPALLRPLAPQVDIAPLPGGNSVQVMAVKARTGVSWRALRPVTLAPPPNP